MSETITTPRNHTAQRMAIAGAVALGLGGMFLLGRNSAQPGTPRAASEHVQPTAPAEKEAPAEPTEVKLEGDSLRLAGLKVEPVGLRRLQSTLAVTGTVEPNLGGVVKITPRAAGKITTVLVNVGDNVRQGQTLATLASAELAHAQAAFRQAGSRVGTARLHLQRQRKLAGLGEFGRHPVEEARGADVAAQGEINTTQSELNAARNEVTEARSERSAFQGEVASAEAEATAAQSEITEAQGQVRALQAALAQAQTGAAVAQSKFNRYDRLLKEQLVSRQDWEQAEADLQRSRSDVEAARANLAQGQAKVETARGHLKAAQARIRAAEGRVEQAAAKIESATARQAQVEAKLLAARKRGEISNQALAREEKIYRGGLFTSKEVTEAEAALRQAEAERTAAGDQIHLLGGTPGGGNVIPVLAPISGRVTERVLTLGETVSPEKDLLTIINLNTVWVQLSVYQKDLPTVRLGQAVRVVADTAPGRAFSGTISYIGDQVDETTRTVKVRCVVQNRGDALKPQTFVRGEIAGAGSAPGVAVPRDAVQELDGKKVVFVRGREPTLFRAREVQPGEAVGGMIPILAGLQPGEQVVTGNAFVLKAQAMKGELSEE